MAIIVYAALCLGLTMFVVGCVRRVIEYASMPIHLRWELYPVPHEQPDRVTHGGSYFEDSDWWTRPRRRNVTGELRVMIPEILFLKGLWEFKRRLWLPSFLFHFGLYLLLVTALLIGIYGGLPLVAPRVEGSVGAALAILSRFTGYGGSLLCVLGAFMLFLRRVADQELKNYTKPADFFNLLSFAAALTITAAGHILRPPGTAGISDVARGLFRFDARLSVSWLLALGLVLSSALVAYIPFTHMAHFIAKYFTYHLVRWDDQPNVRGGSIESRVAQYLTYRPTWSASHVGADGKKTWVDVATANPAQEARQ